MNIGRLRHRIRLQKQRNRPSDYGATIDEWHDVHHVWAEVKPLSGREYFAAAQIQSEVTTQIWLRYLPNVDSTMRVVFGERIYDILSVINRKSLNKTLLLQCKESANERER
ncbi:head-tail adaptor protein [Pasteurellaceae bacterium Orientalotternb1]|nr:head-tail adaptor protein [Pasteurellaceae bacterium Orientalotternb1]